MRVLVVEDDPSVGELVVETLQAQRYAVDWTQRGDAAWELLQDFPYDLVVLDLMLPGLDGVEVLRRLRDARMRVPVLVLTARDGVQDRVRGLELGADDYLVKPFHLDELRARTRALLRRSRGEAANRVEVGRLVLDLEARRAWWTGQPLDLSGQEYTLLAFLALHADGVFPREALLEHAWPGDREVDPRNVDTYVGYLRRKLADDAIRTVRGLGYRFEG